MKKPKFHQLRGTTAQPLRHRICLGITLASTVLAGVCSYALYLLIPNPGRRHDDKLKYFSINPVKRQPVFDIEVEHPD